MTESPLLECLPICEKSECHLYQPPDSPFRDRLEFHAPENYKQLKIPKDFSSFGDYLVSQKITFVLKEVLPNTPFEDAIKYLRTASYLLFMQRAHEGIIRSKSKDLILAFEDALSGKGEAHLNQLEDHLKVIRSIDLGKNSVDTLANRTKSIFSLLMAIKVAEKIRIQA